MTGPRFCPDFFLVGASKCGTTSLAEALDRHPAVCMGRVKEPHHFGQRRVPADKDHLIRPVRDAEAYRALWADCPEGALTGDASTSYLFSPEARDTILGLRPDARILVLLRDPITRAWSEYLMARRNGWYQTPFLDVAAKELADLQAGREPRTRLLQGGLYHDAVAGYRAAFGADQVLVQLTETLNRSPGPALAEVAAFLGLPMPEGWTLGRHNPYREPRGALSGRVLRGRAVRKAAQAVLPLRARQWLHDRVLLRAASRPEVPAGAYPLLVPFFAPEVARLEVLLGRPLPALRKGWPEAA